MALRDDLKLYIAMLIGQVINRSTGDIITNERWNELFTLLVTQGDDTAETLRETLDMLYETLLDETDGASHLKLVDAEFTGGDLKSIVLELASRIASNDADIAADVAALATHITSADHDSRYYTETEINALIVDLQNQVNGNDADIVALNALIAALNDTYSTDVERINAINQVVLDYEAADNNLTTLLGNKANSADVYTKAQIDAMTLGSYKLDYQQKNFTATAPITQVAINVPGFNSTNDSLLFYKGGDIKTPGVEYQISVDDLYIESLEGTWISGTEFDWVVVKNIRVIDPGDYVDGALIAAGSITRDKLVAAVTAELDQLRTDVDAADAKAVAAQATADSKTDDTTVNAHTAVTDIHRKITISTSDPSGGVDGDIWIKYTP